MGLFQRSFRLVCPLANRPQPIPTALPAQALGTRDILGAAVMFCTGTPRPWGPSQALDKP